MKINNFDFDKLFKLADYHLPKPGESSSFRKEETKELLQFIEEEIPPYITNAQTFDELVNEYISLSGRNGNDYKIEALVKRWLELAKTPSEVNDVKRLLRTDKARQMYLRKMLEFI